MHYNFKAEIERIGSAFVAHVEVSGAGRAGNRRVTGDTIEDILDKVKATHAELFGGVEAYHAASVQPAVEEDAATKKARLQAEREAASKAKRDAAAAAKKAAKAAPKKKATEPKGRKKAKKADKPKGAASKKAKRQFAASE